MRENSAAVKMNSAEDVQGPDSDVNLGNRLGPCFVLLAGSGEKSLKEGLRLDTTRVMDRKKDEWGRNTRVVGGMNLTNFN